MNTSTHVSVGQRIREARNAASLTQQDLAKYLGMSRAAIAQWETDVTSPSVATITEVAKFIPDTSPQWLAYGVGGEPQIVRKAPEGTVELKEVVFGDTLGDVSTVSSWNLPVSYLKSDLHVLGTEGVIIWRVEADTMSPTYEYGDRTIVDTNSKKVSPPGIFLIWDGIGASLAHIRVAQTEGGQVARVSASANGSDSWDVPLDKLVIIGRVRGRLHAS